MWVKSTTALVLSRFWEILWEIIENKLTKILKEMVHKSITPFVFNLDLFLLLFEAILKLVTHFL